MIYVVPSLALTVVMTSDHTGPSGRGGYVRELHALLEGGMIRAAENGDRPWRAERSGAAAEDPRPG